MREKSDEKGGFWENTEEEEEEEEATPEAEEEKEREREMAPKKEEKRKKENCNNGSNISSECLERRVSPNRLVSLDQKNRNLPLSGQILDFVWTGEKVFLKKNSLEI